MVRNSVKTATLIFLNFEFLDLVSRSPRGSLVAQSFSVRLSRRASIVPSSIPGYSQKMRFRVAPRPFSPKRLHSVTLMREHADGPAHGDPRHRGSMSKQTVMPNIEVLEDQLCPNTLSLTC